MGIEALVAAVPPVAWLAATLGLVGASILHRLLGNGDGDDGGEEEEALDESIADASSDDELDATDTDITETDMNDGDKSFSELKEEYDAGAADWADDVGVGDDLDGDPVEGEDDEASVESISSEIDDDQGTAEEPEPGPKSEFESEPEREPEPEFEPEPEPEPERQPDQEAKVAPAGKGFDPASGRDPAAAGDRRPKRDDGRNRRDSGAAGRRGEDGFEYVDPGGPTGREKPYLASFPDDYVGDLVVMEWLEFLVSSADVTDAVRAINYYERIEWITPAVADRLREFVSGFGRVDLNLVDQPGTDVLTREHHTQSLRYITQLNGATAHSVLLDRWDDFASGTAFGARGTGGDGSPTSGGARTGNGAGRSEPPEGKWERRK